MAQASVFPAFINVGLDSGSTGFRELKTAAADAGSYMKQQFERELGGVQDIIRKALTLPPGASGALNIDTSGMRQAAAQAEVTARATREVARALQAAAESSNDYTAATRRQIQAAQGAASDAEQEARALGAKAAAYERVQVELDRTGTQITAYTGANGRLVASQRAVTQASIGAGQQLQDIAVSLVGGQKAGIVFAQQLPQLAFALSALEGSTNKTQARIGQFATFLSGPWGLAVGLGVGVLATLTAGLFENAEATDAVEDAHKALEKSLADISTFFDLATGAINRQNEALIANARLKRLDERDDLRKAIASNQDRGRSLVEGSMRGNVSFGGTFGNETGRANIVRSGPSDLVAAIRSANGDQNKMGAELVKLARGQGENATRARALLDLMGEDANNRNRLRELSLEEESLRTGKLSTELMKPTKTARARSATGGADKELRAAQAVEDAVNKASDAVANLRGQFDDAPKDIDKAAAAMLELEQQITKLDRREAAGKLTDAEKTKDAETRREIEKLQKETIPAFKERPVVDRIKSADKELQIQRLLLQGRDDEADKLSLTHDLMRQLGADTEEQFQAQLKGRNITAEQLELMYKQAEQARENARIMARMDRSVQSTRSQIDELGRAYSSIEQAVANLPNDARGALKDLVGNLRQQVNEIIARRITDNLFGNLFAKLEDDIRGKKPIDIATENYVASTVSANTALIDLTETFIYAAGAMRGAANDNALFGAKAGNSIAAQIAKAGSKSTDSDGDYDPNAEIVVSGRKPKINREQRQVAEAMEKSAKSLKELVRGAAQGAFIGQSASSLAFGGKGSSLGSAIGGALGNTLGEKFLGKGLETIAKGLGDFAGPLGSIAGGLIGGALGGLLSKTPRGYATIGGADGKLAVTGTGGNSNSAIKAGNQAAGATLDTLDKIAGALGGSYDAARGSVSIGRSGDSWHVDTTGQGRLKKSQGGFDFDDDYESAVRFATMDLIKDGVITGLRASTQRLLQQGKDIDAALQKALDFESVFSRLKGYRDPVGAALDTLDKEFAKLKGIFAEAGASAAEYADLEALYGIERAKAIEEAASRVTGSLQSLFDDLTIGDNGRSLRDRLGAAQSAYDPLKARVLAGDRSAYDAFAEAAQSLLDVQRQFSGSQSPYFSLLDEVTQITKSRIDAEKNIVSIAENRDSPFGSTGATKDNYQPVVSAIDRTNEILISGFRALTAAGAGGAGYTSGFLTAPLR
jgi:hypothetical protein